MEKQNLFEAMAARWPSDFVARESVPKFTGDGMSARYIANLDCAGKGPAGRFRLGRKIVYPVRDLIEWLNARSEPVAKKNHEG